MNKQQFQAGAANVNITPAPGTCINGDFVTHYATYIHDDLHARALVLEDAGTCIAIVVVDICAMPKDFLDTVKSDINRHTGIPAANILISATHTHAGGSVASVYLGAADLQYMRRLPPLIVQSVVLAKQNLRPAKIAWGAVDVPAHVLSRRYKMKAGYEAINPVSGHTDKIKTNPFGAEHLIEQGIGMTDPEVAFLAVKGVDDRWISVVANYSLHYVGDWPNGTISSDYFGAFSRQLQTRLQAGDDFAGMMSNGTSGNINIWDFQNPGRYPTQSFEKSGYIGGDIAEKVYRELDHAAWDNAPVLSAQYEELTLRLRKPSTDELQQAKQIVAEADYEHFQFNNEGLRQLYAREQVLLHELPDGCGLPVQALKIGKGIIGGIGAEIFAETGRWLKDHSPVKNYFTVTLANGNAGYVPPAHEFDNGGYETWRSRTSKLQTNAEEIIRNKLLPMISALSNI